MFSVKLCSDELEPVVSKAPSEHCIGWEKKNSTALTHFNISHKTVNCQHSLQHVAAPCGKQYQSYHMADIVREL